MSRPHPFDVIHGALTEEWFREVGDTDDLLQFQRMAPVQRALGELKPGEAEAAGAAAEEYGILLYVTYRFWSAGRHSLALQRAAVERALAREATGSPQVPHGACYLQLPERLFWARIGAEVPPEPLDGLFLATSAGAREITVLAVLGWRPERSGFSQIAITARPEDFAQARQFARRPPFAPVLDGGERAGVKSLVSEAELLHLACLALAEAAR